MFTKIKIHGYPLGTVSGTKERVLFSLTSKRFFIFTTVTYPGKYLLFLNFNILIFLSKSISEYLYKTSD